MTTDLSVDYKLLGFLRALFRNRTMGLNGWYSQRMRE